MSGDDGDIFNGLPYAGNHNDICKVDQWNTFAVFFEGHDRWYFTYDQSWDNVDFVGKNISKREVADCIARSRTDTK